jgi:hypothetical protein
VETVNERSSCVLQVAFYDENEDAVIPAAGTYQIDDGAGTAILAATAFTPSAATHNLQITSAQNRILDATKPSEKRIVTVTYQYGDGKQGTGDYTYMVKNLSKVT